MKKLKLLRQCAIVLSVVPLLFSCKDSTPSGKTVTGFVQKGPFLNGSSVTISDLKSDLTPTGLTFESQITDNNGTFKVSNTELSTDYIGLRADGFYFNEVTGEESAAQITLYALANVSDSRKVNVNILTSLEKPRVENLMAGGKTFAEAKKQAEKEVLAIFNIVKDDIQNAEDLDISKNGADNGILLAVSALIQGFRSESQMSELIANICNDIKTDGTLDDPALGSALINHAIYLDTLSIREHITERFAATATGAVVPWFGWYIGNFIDNTEFAITGSPISYPESTTNPDNILSLTQTNYTGGIEHIHSLAADLAPGMSLKIKITVLSTDADPIPLFYRFMGSELNWNITNFEFSDYSQIFTSVESGKMCDLNMFFDPGTFKIEYFENNSAEPTRTKTIVCN